MLICITSWVKSIIAGVVPNARYSNTPIHLRDNIQIINYVEDK